MDALRRAIVVGSVSSQCPCTDVVLNDVAGTLAPTRGLRMKLRISKLTWFGFSRGLVPSICLVLTSGLSVETLRPEEESMPEVTARLALAWLQAANRSGTADPIWIWGERRTVVTRDQLVRILASIRKPVSCRVVVSERERHVLCSSTEDPGDLEAHLKKATERIQFFVENLRSELPTAISNPLVFVRGPGLAEAVTLNRIESLFWDYDVRGGAIYLADPDQEARSHKAVATLEFGSGSDISLEIDIPN